MDVYKTSQESTYLFLPQGQPFSSLPQTVLDQLGTLQLFRTVELGPNFIGANPAQIQQDFQKQGYSIRGMKFNIWERP